MAKDFDVIIFGATGFTGQVVVEQAVEYYRDLKWAIAGRHPERLERVLKFVGEKLGKDLSKQPLIIADVANQQSIQTMAERCRVLINCCGPYHLYGEPVVKACIEAGTHHLDVSGEPEYIDKMQLLYNDRANETGSYVVSACGFESLPAELAVNYMEQQFEAAGGILNSVELFMDTSIKFPDEQNRTLLNSGTWESAILAMARGLEWLRVKASLNCKPTEALRPKLRPRLVPFEESFSDKCFIFFPLTDRSVVQRSQRVANEMTGKRPVQFEMYAGFGSRWLVYLLPFYMMFLSLLSLIPFTRNILIKNPKFFSMGLMSHQGPPEGNKKNLHFSLYAKAKGWSNQAAASAGSSTNFELLGRLKGTDPCYGIAAACIMCAAKVILKESNKMPRNGGVLTPGVAFAKTSLIKEVSQLKEGITFEIL